MPTSPCSAPTQRRTPTYVNGVRGEYGHLSAAEWASGRAAVVESLLARDSLYATAPARSWWEDRARANLTAELAGLAR